MLDPADGSARVKKKQLIINSPLRNKTFVWIPYLVVHNNLVGRRIQMRGLLEELSFLVLGLLPVRLLHVVGGQHIVGSHLILFEIPIANVALGSGCLKDLYEIRCLVLLIVSNLD